MHFPDFATSPDIGMLYCTNKVVCISIKVSKHFVLLSPLLHGHLRIQE